MSRATNSMKWALHVGRGLSLILIAFSLFAQESKPEPTVAELKAEVESLKAQLDQLQTAAQFEIRLCKATVTAAREFVEGPAKPQAPQRPKPEVAKPAPAK